MCDVSEVEEFLGAEKMQTRYMEISNSSVARGKRSLESIGSEEEVQPHKKRLALANVIIEALKVDSLQKLCSSLEPVLRRVVSEEVERALSKLGPVRLNGRLSAKRIERHDGRNLQLHFRSKLSLPLFTGAKIEGEQGAAIHVVLINANTGHIVTSGTESSAKLDVVVLEGDFNNEDDVGWTREEFESHMVKEREGKRPLLAGDLQVTLMEGIGTLGDLAFTDNSSWVRSRKFRLGLRVTSGFCEGIRIRGARTDPFSVKDHRGELYKKHYPPAFNDEVWRLEKIGKDGSFHKRLNKAGMHTVEDFLRFLVRDAQRLRSILGSGMSNKMWDVLVEHAKTCALNGKLYVYYPDEVRNVGVVFNNIYELNGLIADGQYYSAESLSDSQKVYVDTMMKKAYENWIHVVEYDGESLLSFAENESSGVSQSDPAVALQNYSTSFDHQLTLSSLPTSVPPKQPFLDPGVTSGGYDDNITRPNSRYPNTSKNMNLNASNQLDVTSFNIHNQFICSSEQTQLPGSENVLAFGPPQSSISGFNVGGTINPTSYKGSEDFLSEEEIRTRSHQLLNNEDMQYLLHSLNMGAQGHASTSTTNESYPYSSTYMPNLSSNYVFDDYQIRSSGKAVVGWLKLKAALRWGIFIRKKAAERRAQIVELDES